MKYSIIFIGISSMLLQGCWLIDESQFPITNPQSVIATTNSKISFEAVIVNGKQWPKTDEMANIILQGPRPNLAGISAITIGTGYKKGMEKADIGFHFWMPEDNNISEISISDLGLSFDDLVHESLYPEIQYTTNLYEECPHGNAYGYRGPDKPPTIPIIPRGRIILEQRTKHITLKGTFDIPPTAIPRDPYMMCDATVDEKTGFYNKPYPPVHRNLAPPAIIEVRGIHLDIDTDLIFRWCSKGAKCYEK